MAKGRVHLVIHGKVQGVFYRASARERAEEFGLVGWVRNNRDGSVEVVAEGEKEDLREFIAWCHRGPSHSIVRDVSVEWEECSGQFSEFTIEYI